VGLPFGHPAKKEQVRAPVPPRSYCDSPLRAYDDKIARENRQTKWRSCDLSHRFDLGAEEFRDLGMSSTNELLNSKRNASFSSFSGEKSVSSTGRKSKERAKNHVCFRFAITSEYRSGFSLLVFIGAQPFELCGARMCMRTYVYVCMSIYISNTGVRGYEAYVVCACNSVWTETKQRTRGARTRMPGVQAETAPSNVSP